MGAHTHHSRSNTNVYEGRKGKVSSSHSEITVFGMELKSNFLVYPAFGVGNGGSHDLKGPSGMGRWHSEHYSRFRKIRQDAAFRLRL